MRIGGIYPLTMKSSALKWIARFRCDPSTLLIALVAGLGTAHILVRTAPYGAVVGTDFTHLLSTAINFLAGKGWRDFQGVPLTTWPPLFPLLLAASGWVGIEPLTAGRYINATAFGLTILVAGSWLRSNLQSRGLVLAATGAIAASVPLSELAASLMTESLFVLLTLLALMQLAAFLQRGGRTPLLWAAVCTALAAVLRYPGVVLIGVGVLMLLGRRAPPLAARLKDAIVFGAVSFLPLAVVMTRNWTISGTLTGPRGGAGLSLSDALSRVADVFREWVIPPNALDWFGYLLWMVTGLGAPDWFGALLWATIWLVVVAMVAVVAVSGSLGGQNGGDGGTICRRPRSFGLGPALPFGGFALAYLIFMVAIVPLVEPIIRDRFLLPVYVPLLLVAVLLLDRFLSIEVAGRVAAAKWGLASLVLLGTFAHIGFSAQKNLRLTALTAQALESGDPDDGAFNVVYWQHSAVLNYIRDHLSDGITYSNNHYLLWFADQSAAIRTHRMLPYSIGEWWTRKARQWSKRKREVYIVWIKDTYRTEYYDYNDLDLRLLPGVEEVVEWSDSVVFRVRGTATEPFDADRHRVYKQRAQEHYVAQLLTQAGERVVRAGWDVYRNGRKLTYVKKPCAPADVQAKFILHVTPAAPSVLPIARRRYGFDNLGFHFDWLRRRHRLRVADQCIAIVDLPAYAIDRIRVGQWMANGNRTVWDAEFSPGR